MDFNAILGSAASFFSEGIGKVISDVLNVFYSLLYPANADAAHPIEIPR